MKNENKSTSNKKKIETKQNNVRTMKRAFPKWNSANFSVVARSQATKQSTQ